MVYVCPDYRTFSRELRVVFGKILGYDGSGGRLRVEILDKTGLC